MWKTIQSLDNRFLDSEVIDTIENTTMNQPRSKASIWRYVPLVLVVLAVCLVGGFGLLVLIGSSVIIDATMVGETGPVASPEAWPDPLKSLTEDLGEAELDRASIQVYCLCQGMDPEYVWRMDAAPGLFEHIEDRWGLSRIDNPNWRVLDGSSSLSGVATPDWWSPQRDKGTSFFVCPQELEGRKGDRFKVALDAERNTIFVHYWFNF